MRCHCTQPPSRGAAWHRRQGADQPRAQGPKRRFSNPFLTQRFRRNPVQWHRILVTCPLTQRGGVQKAGAAKRPRAVSRPAERRTAMCIQRIQIRRRSAVRADLSKFVSFRLFVSYLLQVQSRAGRGGISWAVQARALILPLGSCPSPCSDLRACVCVSRATCVCAHRIDTSRN